MIAHLASIPCLLLAAAAMAATSNPADPADKHIHVGQYDLATNLWGIRGAGNHWEQTIFTGAGESIAGGGYTWSGFDGNASAVKAYPSLRYGASNRQNDPGASGLPYRFGGNDRNVDVVWDFSATAEGKYNHTLDIFFNATDSTRQAEIRGEIMVITDSSQDAQTAGWGVRDAVAFVIGGETWDVWQATQASNGHSWHVTQFRKRVNAQHFAHNLRDFFGEAAARRPDIFSSSHYVMMVEAGTEIKTGSGRVVHRRFSVSVY
jgi:hypothetical protein